MLSKKKHLIIIDSNSVIHRAFHALPPLTTKGGELTNAIYGFFLVFFRALKEFQPDYIAACFDTPKPTFRHQKFKEYKIKRPPTPEDLSQQIPKIKEILSAFNVPVFEKEGFEADDIIGTIAFLAPRKQVLPRPETIILSGDSDILQLVDAQTRVYILKKGIKDVFLYDEKSVKEKFSGLNPKQIIGFKSLRGDPSDNIPGVPGIGEKTAIQLIKNFGSLENLYKKIQIPESESQINSKIQIPDKLKTKLIEYKEQAFFSKTLAEIERGAPIDFCLEKCRWGKYSKEKVTKIFKNFEFHSLIKKLPEF